MHLIAIRGTSMTLSYIHRPGVTQLKSYSLRMRLLEVLNERFSTEDLQTLCFDLQVDYRVLDAGVYKGSLARELILYMERRGRIEELVEAVRSARPSMSDDITEIVSIRWRSARRVQVRDFLAKHYDWNELEVLCF